MVSGKVESVMFVIVRSWNIVVLWNCRLKEIIKVIIYCFVGIECRALWILCIGVEVVIDILFIGCLEFRNFIDYIIGESIIVVDMESFCLFFFSSNNNGFFWSMKIV